MKKTTYIILILTFFFSFFISKAQEDAWELVSMNPPRGIVGSIAKSSEDGLFVGSTGGAFSSFNNGESWDKLIDGFTEPLYMSKNDVVILRMNDLRKWEFSLWLSFDLGKTWSKKLNSVSAVLLDKNQVLITVNRNDTHDIYLSNDFVNWSKISQLPDSLIEYSGCCDGFFKDSIIYHLAYTLDQKMVYLLVTTDLGKTWKKIFLPDGSRFNSLYIKSNEESYASSNNGIFFSSDKGLTWSLKWLENKKIYKFFFVNDQIIFASAFDGVYYTLDGGENWNLSENYDEFNISESASNRISLAFNFDSKNSIYSAPKYQGIYKSENLGKNWYETNNGFSGWPTTDFVLYNNNIFMSCWGIFKSTDKGKTFDYLDLKAYDTGPIAVNSKGYIFVGDKATGNTYRGIFRSTDDGNSWHKLPPNYNTINSLICTKNDVLIAAIGPGYIDISTDDGLTWNEAKTSGRFLALNDENHIFTFHTGDITRSTDEGKTWEKVAETQVDPTYIELGGRIIFNNKTKTAAYYDLVTTDNGRNWVKQLDNHYIFGTTSSNKYAVDSTYNWVLAGGDYINRWTTHIERSTDNGKTWYRMDTTGLKHKEFKTIGCSPDGHIYVFGATGGLYRSRDKFVSVKEVPKPKADIFNSPNPFSETTHILFTLLNPGDVRLTVYDLLGNIIETKNYGLLDSGENTILFDGEKYPSGIYFYRIESNQKQISLGYMNLVK